MGNRAKPEQHTANTEQNGGWLYHPVFPEHWESRSLYSLAEWVNGLAFRDIQFSPTGKPVIKIAEIKGGISRQTEFTEQAFDESVHVRAGDLLFSWSGQPESSIDAFWWRGPDGWLNQHVFRVTPIEQLDRTFFYYLLRYLKPNFIGIARNKQTTGLGHVTKRDLESIQAAYPTLEEQRAIAHILGTLDDKIELNRRMNETLEAMARAIFKSWFIDFDPVRAKMEGRWQRGQSLPGLPAHLFDLWPDSFQDSPLGKIPTGWRVSDFPEEIDFLEGPGLRNWQYRMGGIRFLNIRCIEQGDLLIEKANYISEAEFHEKYSHFALREGDIVISTSGTLGRLAIVRDDHLPIMLNTSIIRMRGKGPVGLAYVWATLQSDYFLDEMFALASGSVQLNFGPMHLRRMKLLRPADSILKQFENIAGALLRLALANRQESKTLAAIRDALLPKLISGEIRVKDAEKLAEASR
jgi:type I restriction enzyme S subunit